ncbi:hypothetical protein K8352_04795 [Flavobacteriaceae bacterium F89]|uniref:Gfo/Idh/MocA-like oxidoreductase C-terminal domain-containing protein n=1 Tax=Cerina litoralis TaxID=2874477 RepID=A0AAE3ETA9_9FLAO|nr:hypothetical protein [Cerina litoralis]MCG2460053.1 hypothetical protein [Cerina litoralis]
MKHISGERLGTESWIDLTSLPYNRSNVFPYLAAVVRDEIVPGNDLSSLATNTVVVEILSAASESAKTGRTIFLEQ